MQSDAFQIKTTGFEGPFGVLLNLVEDRKLLINDVSLATVTEEYLQYISKLGPAHHDDIASFVVVASTLILIKSKSLLPSLALTDEEEGDIKSLEERLRLYELFTRLGDHIKDNFGENIIFPPQERKSDILVFLPDAQITKESMMAFAQSVLDAMPKKTFMPEVEVKKVVSIEEMIDRLTDRIKTSLQTSFKQMHGKISSREEKVTAIVGFLAMLELVRQGIIHAVQEEQWGDIIMEKQ